MMPKFTQARVAEFLVLYDPFEPNGSRFDPFEPNGSRFLGVPDKAPRA